MFLPVMADETYDQNIAEYRLRMAYIFNFIKFVKWPEERSPQKTGKTEICIAGDKEFSAYAKDLLSHNTGSGLNSLTVLEAGSYDIAKCHVLYAGSEEEYNVTSLLGAAKNYPVLTISEIKDFADKGGIVEIIKGGKNVGLFSQDKVNLKINIKVSEAVNLSIDARLLQIAAEVIK